MSDTRVKAHPRLGILVCTDGHVMMPKNCHIPAHWTFGSKNRYGYLRVHYRGKQYLIHRLVAETFLDNPKGYPTVDHINRVKTDNRLENLRFASCKTQADNTANVDRGLTRYGVRACEDRRGYKRAFYANNPEYAERKRAKDRERYERCANDPEFVEQQRVRHSDWLEKQKALGKKHRRCPDGKRRYLTDEEFNKLYGK